MIYLSRPEDATPGSYIFTVDNLLRFALREQNSVDRHNYNTPSPVD